MTTQTKHILTVAHTADLDAAIGALDDFGIRVVCVDAGVDATFDRVTQLTVRPTLQIDLPVIEYAVRSVGIELLDLRTSDCATPAVCGV